MLFQDIGLNRCNLKTMRLRTQTVISTLSRLRIFKAKYYNFEILLLGYYILMSRAAPRGKTGKTKTVSVSVLPGFCGAKQGGNSSGRISTILAQNIKTHARTFSNFYIPAALLELKAQPPDLVNSVLLHVAVCNFFFFFTFFSGPAIFVVPAAV